MRPQPEKIMKVIVKFRTVEVTYNTGVVAAIKCKTISDALSFDKHFKNAIIKRERACNDESYLQEFYAYLKSKGLVERQCYESHLNLQRKAHLVSMLPTRIVAGGIHA